jgi:malate dehydrogenase
MAFLAWKRSGLPSHRVIGMAGVLDSGRFQRFIADELKVSAEDVRAMVLGGHGDLMVPLPRFSTVNGIPITSLMSKVRIKELCERTRNGGAEIVQYLQSGSAYYAPGASVTMMVEAILKNKRRLLPCSVHANGLYGLGDVYIGLPAIIGAKGVEQVLAPALNIVELRALKRSAASAAAAQAQVLQFAVENKE